MIDYDKNSVPKEESWGDYQTNPDSEWAYEQCFGKTNEELIPKFLDSAFSSYENLYYMTEVPFRYYVFGLCGAVRQVESQSSEAPLLASYFLNLVLYKLENEPRHILPIMSDLMPTLEYVANNQVHLRADIEIFGSFSERYVEIQKVYSERLANPVFKSERPKISLEKANEIRHLAFEAISALSAIQKVERDEYIEYQKIKSKSDVLMGQVQDIMLSYIYNLHPSEDLIALDQQKKQHVK